MSAVGRGINTTLEATGRYLAEQEMLSYERLARQLYVDGALHLDPRNNEEHFALLRVIARKIEEAKQEGYEEACEDARGTSH
jgi:hypothetical protein